MRGSSSSRCASLRTPDARSRTFSSCEPCFPEATTGVSRSTPASDTYADGLAPPADPEDERETGRRRAEVEAPREGEATPRGTRATPDPKGVEHTVVPVTPCDAGSCAPARRDADRDHRPVGANDEPPFAPPTPRRFSGRHDLRLVCRRNRDGAEHKAVAILRTIATDVGELRDVDAFAARNGSPRGRGCGARHRTGRVDESACHAEDRNPARRHVLGTRLPRRGFQISCGAGGGPGTPLARQVLGARSRSASAARRRGRERRRECSTTWPSATRARAASASRDFGLRSFRFPSLYGP